MPEAGEKPGFSLSRPINSGYEAHDGKPPAVTISNFSRFWPNAIGSLLVGGTRQSFGDVIRIRKGYTSGFDYLRIVLSLTVVFMHAYLITGTAIGSGYKYFNHLVLPMFFALSGFLVTASLIRVDSVPVFLILRWLRLFPALCVEVVFAALVIGPIFTTVALHQYFTNPEFFAYFLNVVGRIHFYLPGLFKTSPTAGVVNGSLWTVPFEAECYIALTVISLIGLVRRPLILSVGFLLLLTVLQVYNLGAGRDLELFRATFTGRQLVLCFFGGAFIYLMRDRIPSNLPLLALMATAALLTVASHRWVYASVIPISYVTAYVGLLTPKKIPLIFTGDYSYGVYLYAAPIQQVVQQLYPTNHVLNFLIAAPVVSILAAMSWHLIEKPFLRLKRVLLGRFGKSKSANRDEMISPDKTIEAIATR